MTSHTHAMGSSLEGVRLRLRVHYGSGLGSGLGCFATMVGSIEIIELLQACALGLWVGGRAKVRG